jgi:hypothetical protein
VLKDYYENDKVHLIGKAESGKFYVYVPVSGEAKEYTPILVLRCTV